MKQTDIPSEGKDLSTVDWLAELEAMAYAYGKPDVLGLIKQLPEHFIVIEMMDVEPSGEGEHYWLDITKTRLNTDAVAKSLARFSGVANRDVGYSGMKDFHAITRQWFSVWKPKGEALDWSNYAFDGVVVNAVVKHSRKIKRGTHRANQFQIRVVGLQGTGSQEKVQETLNSRLELIQRSGVPNYYGAQRFGRRAHNLPQALAMFDGRKRVKDRNLRGIFLSSARSWLFNKVVSERISAGTWQSLYLGEPANLNGTNSMFLVEDLSVEAERLHLLDIHPTAPLYGERKRGERKGQESNDASDDEHSALAKLEKKAMTGYQALQSGLEGARVEYQRRALRIAPKQLHWEYDQGDLCVSFELHRGQFATSVLRELIGEINDTLPNQAA